MFDWNPIILYGNGNITFFYLISDNIFNFFFPRCFSLKGHLKYVMTNTQVFSFQSGLSHWDQITPGRPDQDGRESYSMTKMDKALLMHNVVIPIWKGRGLLL